MPRTTSPHNLVWSIQNGTVKVESGSLKDAEGMRFGLRPVGLSVTSIPPLVNQVPDASLKDVKGCSELDVHKARFATAKDAVKALKGLKGADTLDALIGLKEKDKGAYDSVVAFIATETGGKLTVDIL